MSETEAREKAALHHNAVVVKVTRDADGRYVVRVPPIEPGRGFRVVEFERPITVYEGDFIVLEPI